VDSDDDMTFTPRPASTGLAFSAAAELEPVPDLPGETLRQHHQLQ
jgi:hypothetical protein